MICGVALVTVSTKSYSLILSAYFTPQISMDPFKDCRIPTLFAVGSEGRMTSVAYTEVS